jgi:hypothetical protein
MNWKLRIGLLALFLIVAASTRGWWIPALGWGLVSDSGPCKPDLILVDNLEPDYLAFEKAAELERIDGARMVLVPVTADGRDSKKPGLVASGVADVMIRAARLQSTEILPFRQIEPLTLNTARQVAAFLKPRRDIRSVLVVTDGFRSRRTQMIYSSVFSKIGISTYTCPVWGTKHPDNWAATWHGRQEVLLQYLKLFYYEIILLKLANPENEVPHARRLSTGRTLDSVGR